MPALTAISVDVPVTNFDVMNNWGGRSGKFIKGFLLNEKRNKNGWMVPWEVIKKYASDFVNHPGIFYEKGGEPDHTGGETYKENMANQEDYRVVNIVDVQADEATHTLNYTGEIIDAEFEALWNAGKINMTSPAVWPIEMRNVGVMPNGAPKLDVDEYRALHIAYIIEPAYGDDANTIATCDGDGEACRIRLTAKTKSGEECMGLCANNDLAPLMEVPLIRKTLNSQYTACEISDIHAEFIDHATPSPGINLAAAEDCVGNKLKIIMEDNPDMAKDQQLAIAYSYCQPQVMAELVSDIENDEAIEWITVNGNPIPIKPGQNKDDVVKDFIKNQTDSKPKEKTKKETSDPTTKYIPKNDESPDGATSEPIHLTDKPNENHEATAYAVSENYPTIDSEEMIIQAWKADKVRSAHENNLKNSLDILDKGLPNSRSSGRVKTRKSMLDKLARKSKYKNVDDLKDVSGMRVIAPNIADINSSKEFITKNFNVVKEENFMKNPNDGYRAIHFDIKNSDGTISELQLKTANQQKWATTVHNRVYKIPKDKLKETKKLMPEITEYTHKMSDHFFALDNGEESTVPPCPPKINNLGLCM